jgi:hypothetical protein
MFKRITLAFAVMMMTWLVGCPGAFLPGSVFGIAVAEAATPTQILFDYDFTITTNRACTVAITSSCVSSFTESVTNSLGTVVAGPVNIVLPATISTTGPTIGITTPFNVPATLGPYNILVQVVYKDNAGVAQGGPTASLGYSVTPTGALNVRVQ